MKVIVTGGTGIIGEAVLQRCIAIPQITQVYALTRRELPRPLASNPKIKTIIHEDFTTYSESVLAQLEGAEACIWSLGISIAQGRQELETYRKADVVFTTAAVEAFLRGLKDGVLGGPERKFRFVFVSAWIVTRELDRKLWLMEAPRRSKVQSSPNLSLSELGIDQA
jgi:nucleoside-diphosphate-sugar epimerase